MENALSRLSFNQAEGEEGRSSQLESLGRLSARNILSVFETGAGDPSSRSAIHYTISQDRCGTQEAVIQSILAPLAGRRSRGKRTDEFDNRLIQGVLPVRTALQQCEQRNPAH